MSNPSPGVVNLEGVRALQPLFEAALAAVFVVSGEVLAWYRSIGSEGSLDMVDLRYPVILSRDSLVTRIESSIARLLERRDHRLLHLRPRAALQPTGLISLRQGLTRRSFATCKSQREHPTSNLPRSRLLLLPLLTSA